MSSELPPLNVYLEQLIEGYEYVRDYENFQTPLWEFNRKLLKHPDLRRLEGPEAKSKVEELMELSGHVWTDISGIDSMADGTAEFCNTWDRILFPEGENGETVLYTARTMALKNPIPFVSRVFPDAGYYRFLSFMYWLHMLKDPTYIIASCRKLGEVMDVSAQTLSIYRRYAGLGKSRKADDLLEEIRPFRFSSDKPSRATLCRFRIEKLPEPWCITGWWEDADLRKSGGTIFQG